MGAAGAGQRLASRPDERLWQPLMVQPAVHQPQGQLEAESCLAVIGMTGEGQPGADAARADLGAPIGPDGSAVFGDLPLARLMVRDQLGGLLGHAADLARNRGRAPRRRIAASRAGCGGGAR